VESERLKAKLGAAMIERDLLNEERAPVTERHALLPLAQQEHAMPRYFFHIGGDGDLTRPRFRRGHCDL
jgi:hypothetical protein